MTRVNLGRALRRVGRGERVVRPYAVTAGRTRPTGENIDMAALVSVIRAVPARGAGNEDVSELGPEHVRVLRFCRSRPSAADLAAELDLPLGVVRILLADLRERGLVKIYPPASAGLADVSILKEVADALRRI
jgi:Protein of unknown function (DUF742)